MSADKASSPCSKFQANIFNKSKCQNCFKSRELHLLNDRDMEQAKPIYGGWLCLAPEGTDFDNPMQRSRKWQRRFFILYEHGSLTFALDELPSTLPQGTVNMNLCTDIADAEPRTGQRNALCVVTSEQEIFIRGDNKEIINGWSDQLAVYLRSNKQNQKKKRKVEPVATQEPSPAKMAATDLSVSALESGCGRWQEDQRGRGLEKPPIWTVTDRDPPGPEQTPAGNAPNNLCPRVSRDPLSLDVPGSFRSRVGSLDLVSNGSAADPGADDRLAERESSNIQTSANNRNQSNGGSHGGRAESTGENAASVSRTGRSEARASKREKLQSCGDITQLAAPPPQRRSKSLDRRTSDTVMTPDLLNFKKGWMVKLDDNGKWKKYWFVLSTDSLRYYRDSIAEEASDLDGEIDLTKCYNVSEYQVQRNYGFQIHTAKGVYTLSAMTAGIRKNWIQSLMKNVHPANAPDVASLPGLHAPCSPPDALPKPDLTQDSPSTDISSERDTQRRSVMEKRREGRYKTFDWAEFRPQSKPAPDADLQRSAAPCALELADLERRKRREERRRRYESMLGFSLGWEAVGDESSRVLSPRSQQKVAEDIEECWRQVETTMFRLDRTVPLFPEARDAAEMERLLDSYKKGVEDLKTQLAESERLRRDLEAQLSAAGYQQQRVCPLCDTSPASETDPPDASEKPPNSCTHSPTDACREKSEQQNNVTAEHQTPSIWLQDTEGNFQELRDLLPDWTETAATPLLSPTSDTPLLSPTSDSVDSPSDSEGQSKELHDVITKLQDHQDEEDCLRYSNTDTQISDEYSSLILEKAADGGDGPCLEQHIPPDQAKVRKLSQEVELLTSQNEALNQRNQEMLNQLTEADREIERLKAELSSRYTEPHHLPEVEQQVHAKLEDLERELGLRDQKLLEAQALIASLEENLRDAEALLQLAEPAEAEGSEREEGAAEAEGYLLRCFEASEAKLMELEQQLGQSEATCRELRARSTELGGAEEDQNVETEADVGQLSRETLKDEGGEERTREVIEGMIMRLKVLDRILKVVSRLDLDAMSGSTEGEQEAVSGQLRREEEFWSSLLREAKAGSPSQLDEEKSVEALLVEVTERMIAEKQLLLFGHEQRRDAGEKHKTLKDLDVVLDAASASETMDESFDFSERTSDMDESVLGRVGDAMQMQTWWLESIASSDSVPERVQLIAERLFGSSEQPLSNFIYSAGAEAMHCCHISWLRSAHRRELEEARQKLLEEARQELLAASLSCGNCAKLVEENTQLREKLSSQEEPQKADACCQTDERETKPRVEAGTSTDELWGESEQNEISDEIAETLEMEKVLLLTEEVKTLEEQLSAIAEQLKDEFESKMSSVRTQHEREMEKLKATFEYGLSTMEDSHVKVVEELQRRQQLEVERLLAERDRVLEEETAATAIAIEAIQNAHRLELEKEVQRRWQWETNTQLEDVYRRHSEELASAQRELEVLSQQFCLKCLENEHLVQALDAERKALCQCQQENQDLRTRNQELSGHLAAEITRLCTLAKQDHLPLSQGMDVYQMEITLRVKDSEVQCLKQEIKSLKDELLSAHKDKRNATKKYKDIYAELSIVRAKTECELDELRENLRLANLALSRISP